MRSLDEHETAQSMTYIKVKWLHHGLNEPIWLLSELGAYRWERRKIEIFADGFQGYASDTEQIGGTLLGEAPIPPLAEIAADPQFAPQEITEEEFEAAWRTRGIRAASASLPG